MSLAPVLAEIPPPETWTYGELIDRFFWNLDEPSACRLPLPPESGRMSLSEWWASNVVDGDLVQVIEIVRDSPKGEALIEKLARDYARMWSQS